MLGRERAVMASLAASQVTPIQAQGVASLAFQSSSWLSRWMPSWFSALLTFGEEEV